MNLPARATVISSVTKFIGARQIDLKTSELLQMAGRAGRRGLDKEGTVVIVGNQPGDSRKVHQILTSPIDPIQSQFKTSYGFVIRLLSSRPLKECHSLIEKGFGAFEYHRSLLKQS
jgi:superfamily II RNA helicase